MNRSRRSQTSLRRSRARGAAIEEALSMFTLLVCVGAPIAAAARYVGPKLADDLDERVHAVSIQDPNAISAPPSNLGDGLDFGSGLGGASGALGASPSAATPRLTTGSGDIATSGGPVVGQ